MWYSTDALKLGLIDGIGNVDDILYQLNRKGSLIYLLKNTMDNNQSMFNGFSTYHKNMKKDVKMNFKKQ